MRVRHLVARGSAQELLRIPGLAYELRLAVRRDVRAPDPPALGPPGTGLAQSRLVAARRRRRLEAIRTGTVTLPRSARAWTSMPW
jgi:hypothetical protein